MGIKGVLMEQLSKEEAGAIWDSGVWKEWSSEEIVGLQLFQTYLVVPFGTFHKAMEDVLDRRVWTHEFSNPHLLQVQYLRRKYGILDVREEPNGRW